MEMESSKDLEREVHAWIVQVSILYQVLNSVKMPVLESKCAECRKLEVRKSNVFETH
ncbi:hypothetical protein Q5741_05485 [Paenibacillus sp. JX-17]|uniref:Uncharacterized protein n=1 Tax=Paenibacillus lacisoli TaxID=3064525 RepID=A0ABT9C9C9_9BACL|nr:hypothetical protein [Paenibacillus sp. JX-17]MDO7905868.1 hypothetical protein [Paenibacillus sp. JX-17]